MMTDAAAIASENYKHMPIMSRSYDNAVVCPRPLRFRFFVRVEDYGRFFVNRQNHTHHEKNNNQNHYRYDNFMWMLIHHVCAFSFHSSRLPPCHPPRHQPRDPAEKRTNGQRTRHGPAHVNGH
jgi:hypothetical protein